MKIKTTLFKLFVVLFGISLLLWNCEEGNIQIPATDSQETVLKTKRIKVSNFPKLNNYLLSLLEEKELDKSVENTSDNYIITSAGFIPLENILQITDTLGATNSTFAIIPKTYFENVFYNLIISENPEEELSSYILGYKMTVDFANAYRTGEKNINEFEGVIEKYNVAAFMASFESAESRTPCEQNTSSNASTCNEVPIDDGNSSGTYGGGNASSNGGGGSGQSSGSNSGGGTVPCDFEVVTTSPSCLGNVIGVHDCEGYTSILYISCADGTSIAIENTSSNTENCPTDSGNQSIGIEVVPFYDLATALSLDDIQAQWLEDNCEEKNQIYSFLNLNTTIINGRLEYTPEDIDFAIYVIDNNCETIGNETEWDDNLEENEEPKWGQLANKQQILDEINNVPNLSNLTYLEQITALANHFERHISYSRDANGNLYIVNLIDAVDRYVYSEVGGWIDFHHVFKIFEWATQNGPFNSIIGGDIGELYQSAKDNNSAYSYEDLPSNLLGVAMYIRFSHDLAQGNITWYEAVETALNEISCIEPEDAPNFEYIPHIINEFYPKNYTYSPLLGDFLRDYHRKKFCERPLQEQKNIKEAHELYPR